MNRVKVLRSSSGPIWHRHTASPDSSKVYRDVKCRLTINSDTIRVSHVYTYSASNSGYSRIRSGRGLFSAFAASPCIDCVLSGCMVRPNRDVYSKRRESCFSGSSFISMSILFAETLVFFAEALLFFAQAFCFLFFDKICGREYYQRTINRNGVFWAGCSGKYVLCSRLVG